MERYADTVAAVSVVTAGGVATRFARSAAQSEAHGDIVFVSEGRGALRSAFASPLPLGVRWERRDRAAESGWSAAPSAWLTVVVVGSAELAAARHRERALHDERARELAAQMRRIGSFVRDGHAAESTVVRVAVADETFAVECGGERSGNTVLWLLSEVERLYGARHDGAEAEIQSLRVRGVDVRTLALGAPVLDVVRASETVRAVGVAIEVRVGHAGPDAAAYRVEIFGAQRYTCRWLLRAVARRYRNERRGDAVSVSMTALRSRVAGDANDVDLDTHVLDTFFTGDVVVALVRGDEGAARAQARRFSREQSKASSCRDERSAQRPAAAAAAKPAPAAAKGMPPPSRGVVALASRWRTGRGAARRAAVDRQCRRASRASRDSPRALPRRCRCAKDAAAIARRRARGGAVPRGCGTNGVSVGIRAAAVPHAVGNVCVLLVRGSTPYHSDSSSPRHDTCAREYALFFNVCAIGCRAGVRLVSRAVRWSQRRVAVRTARARFCASPRVDAKRDGL